MQRFDGSKLPNEILLSDLIDNEHEDVRFVGLKAEQTLVIDVSLDGQYKYPDEPKKAGWTSPDGREGVHTALLTIAKSSGFTVEFTGKAELRNSRGRGLSVSECGGFKIHNAFVRGARTAGIAVQNCVDFSLIRPTTIDTSNYQTERRDVNRWNVSGSIKLDGCQRYTLDRPASIDHMGNGITATESSNGEWIEPFAYGVHGANMYINASPHHVVIRGIAIGGTDSNRPAAYVVNSEEENNGASEGATFEQCYCLDVEWALGFWGNEKKANVVIEEASASGVFVSERGIKFHPNANIKSFHDGGLLNLLEGGVDTERVWAILSASSTLAALIRQHADGVDINTQQMEIHALFDELREPDEPAIEDARQVELRAWLAEADELVPQLAGWLERGRALVG